MRDPIDAFRGQLQRLPPEAASLTRRRRQAFERFAQLGLPSQHDEDWRYVSLVPLTEYPLEFAPPSNDVVDPGAGIAHATLAECDRLVFVDGMCDAGRSRPPSPRAGAVARSLRVAVREDADRYAAELDAELDSRADADEADARFDLLNAALWGDGAVIALEDGAVLERPIQLLFVAARDGTTSHPRNLIRLGAGARATIVEQYAGAGATRSFQNAVTTLELGAAAQVTHIKLQQEGSAAIHFTSLRVQQGRQSALQSLSYALGARLSRTRIGVRLEGESSLAELVGLYVAGDRQTADHHTRIDHLHPATTSREYYKGIVGGAARAVFNGKIVVHPGAQRTQARQVNRNLLLSATAEVDTKPELEIYADDVQCTHGATVSELDVDQLHYLRSRGLDEITAGRLLIDAFAADVLSQVPRAAWRARLQGQIRAAMPWANGA